MKRLCFIGASTTEGMGDSNGLGWPGRLMAVQKGQVVSYNLGIRGQTVVQLERRATAEISIRIPNYDQGGIVVGCPLNELPRQVSGELFYDFAPFGRRYQKLIMSLKEIAPVTVVGPPPVAEAKLPFFSEVAGQDYYFKNTDIAVHDGTMRDLCKSCGVPYISVFEHLFHNPDYIAGLHANDGLHTNGDGYAAQASYLDKQFDFQTFEPMAMSSNSDT